MSETYDAAPVLDGLKSFQRDAVEHTMERLYDPTGSRRFLVADETGLGKSVIARGIIARTIERLQHDQSVDRIDIVYVCSNTDLAQQNLRRLDVTGNPHLAMTTRLSLLARESRRLQDAPLVGGKRVNLVSFTPGTSFDMGAWRTGSRDERALLHLLMCELADVERNWRKRSERIFQGPVRTAGSFRWTIDQMSKALGGAIDPEIVGAFRSMVGGTPMMDEYRDLLLAADGRRSFSHDDKERIKALTGALRSALARASVATLEPDLIILDEFQRFRHLLDADGSEAGELAHHLFDYFAARVVLLSATPYKPFTVGDEGDDDHFADLLTTLSFLSGRDPQRLERIRDGFRGYSGALLSGNDVSAATRDLRTELLQLMSRTERPQLTVDAGLARDVGETVPASGAEFARFVRLQRLADVVDAPISVDYWKSIPHFGNFMRDYAIGRRFDALHRDGDAAAMSIGREAGEVRRDDVSEFADLDLGSGRLERIAAGTLGNDWWKLLWMPASMPYFEPAGPYAGVDAVNTTKQLIFSSWSATPTAIASLLSYHADRRIAEGSRLSSYTAEARKSLTNRLPWGMSEGRPTAMSALALFWPHPRLAALTDPLSLARRYSDSTLTTDSAARGVQLPDGPMADQPWRAFFSVGGGTPGTTDDAISRFGARPTGDADVDEEDAGDSQSSTLAAHLAVAGEWISDPTELSHPDLVGLAMHSPGNVAWRALARIRDSHDATTDDGHWDAAVVLALALRSLMGRPETGLLLDRLHSDETYWRAVVRYCADGNLQAVLDEYVHQLHSELGGRALDDALLMSIATRAADAITLRPATYQARDLDDWEPIGFTARFALRYGGKRESAEDARDPETRNAFNSPFWPFVLASTSVGQEGIDFHWWSHSVVHWNLPSNPVDLEQREGRVNRYGGHAIRKNLAAAHREDALNSDDPNPWRALYASADGDHPEFGEFIPYWVYPGDARVERRVLTYPLSRDVERAARLRRDLTLYRLTLGHPAQGDLLELLAARGVTGSSPAALDLRPPRHVSIEPPSKQHS